MCPSTCASSVVSRLWKYKYKPLIAASTTAPLEYSRRLILGFASPFGVSSSPSSSSVIRGTLAAFSNPTSISTLIAPPLSLRVNLFHLPDGPRKVRARLFEAVARLIHLFFRKLHAQVRHLHFVPRRLQVQQRRLYIQGDLVPQIIPLLLQLSNLQIPANNLRVNPSARKQRQIHARLVCVGW